MMVARIVDDRGVGADEHQVIGRRRSGDFGKVIVAQRILPREREISRNVIFGVLYSVPLLVGALFPRLVPVVWVVSRRILRRLKLDAVRTRESPEIVIEGVIFLHNNYHVIDSLREFSHSNCRCSDKASNRSSVHWGLDRSALSPSALTRLTFCQSADLCEEDPNWDRS